MEVLRDESTGVFSWEAFTAFGTLTASQTRRRGGSLSLFAVSLDSSAFIAQEDGALDEAAVRVVAGALLRTVRGGDMVGRMSPLTFALLAQDAQQSGAMRLAERIQAAVPSQLTVGDRSIPFTISMGISTLPQGGTSLPELLRAAQQALTQAMARGGNAVRMSAALVEPAEPPEAARADSGTPAPVRMAAAILQEALVADRRAALAQLTQSYEHGEIEGIAVDAQPGACPICLDAARDLYLPGWAPSLPLVGCTSPSGCRCNYGSPALDPRRRPPPISSETYTNIDIPRKYRDAALFGSDQERGCKGDELAEYLDAFPLLPFDVAIELQAGEIAYLMRPAQRAWERAPAGQAMVHGPMFPLRGLLSLWVRMAGKPPSIQGAALPIKEDGMLYLTSWRLIFSRRGTLDSVLLADVSGIEYLRNGIACTIGLRNNRLIFLLRDSLQTGLYITRAARDLYALAR